MKCCLPFLRLNKNGLLTFLLLLLLGLIDGMPVDFEKSDDKQPDMEEILTQLLINFVLFFGLTISEWNLPSTLRK